MTEDISLTFDSKPFMQAINNVSKSMTAATSQFSSFVVAKGIMMAGLIQQGFKKIMSGLPEVQRTFSIAGDIMMRNFLWPLRKELVPILQKLLDWVRDHRAMFVQWGVVLVNIFRAIKTIIMSFIDLLKNMWDRLFGGLERLFGRTAMTIQQIINLIIFKITALVMYLQILLEPVFNIIIDLVVKLIGYVASFISGFKKGIGDLMPDLDDFIGQLTNVLRQIMGMETEVGGLNSIFGSLGQLLGGTFKLALVGVTELLAQIGDAIEWVTYQYRLYKAISSGLGQGEIQHILKEHNEYSKKSDAMSKRREKSGDAAIDSIIDSVSPSTAIKPDSGSKTSSKTEINNDNKNVTIHVNGAKSPADTAEAVRAKLAAQKKTKSE